MKALLRELERIDLDVRRTPPFVLLILSCLALLLAATFAFGGLHL